MIDADVCVVGGGYAGLAAARKLSQAGASVVVLEARDRVGGRARTDAGPNGVPLDMGGTWVAPGHDAILGLAKEFGVGTYPTFDDGDVILSTDGRNQRYRGAFPKLNPAVLAGLAVAMARLDLMAKRVDIDTPWAGSRAHRWDTESAASWINRAGRVPTRRAKAMLASVIRGLFTCDPAEVSLLHVLYLIRSAGSLNTLLAVRGGYQDARLSGGAQRIANLMAADLGGDVLLESPAHAIRQTGDAVEVESNTSTVRARRAVVAMPPSLAVRLDYSPALPLERSMALRRMPSGFVLKVLAAYETPFWRADGLSGQSIDFDSPFEITLDISPESGTPGILAAFAFGPRAMDLTNSEARQRAAIEALTTRFGARASAPIHLADVEWATEEWSGGGMMAHFPPGVLSQFGSLLRRPEGRIHWAGTETATVSHGTIDGAVRSGQRAASEIITAR